MSRPTENCGTAIARGNAPIQMGNAPTRMGAVPISGCDAAIRSETSPVSFGVRTKTFALPADSFPGPPQPIGASSLYRVAPPIYDGDPPIG